MNNDYGAGVYGSYKTGVSNETGIQSIDCYNYNSTGLTKFNISLTQTKTQYIAYCYHCHLKWILYEGYISSITPIEIDCPKCGKENILVTMRQISEIMNPVDIPVVKRKKPASRFDLLEW